MSLIEPYVTYADGTALRTTRLVLTGRLMRRLIRGDALRDILGNMRVGTGVVPYTDVTENMARPIATMRSVSTHVEEALVYDEPHWAVTCVAQWPKGEIAGRISEFALVCPNNLVAAGALFESAGIPAPVYVDTDSRFMNKATIFFKKPEFPMEFARVSVTGPNATASTVRLHALSESVAVTPSNMTYYFPDTGSVVDDMRTLGTVSVTRTEHPDVFKTTFVLDVSITAEEDLVLSNMYINTDGRKAWGINVAPAVELETGQTFNLKFNFDVRWIDSGGV